MNYKNILVTGGAGFIGSNLSIRLRAEYPMAIIVAFDNFTRLGSRLNVPRLVENKVEVIEGDVRDREKLLSLGAFDLIIDCAAEPSVLAGREGNPLYVTDVNLGGTLNTLEIARVHKAEVIFLSTSRVYPVELLNSLLYEEDKTRFVIKQSSASVGVSEEGISEDFPLSGGRTLYGATKLSSELFVKEFIDNFGIKAVINRCSVVAGPWQFGKIDQGFVTLWLSKHMNGENLSYIGFGGEGKQVRDVIHVDDLCDAILLEIKDMDKCNGKIYNIGGGTKNSVSLVEMTEYCEKITGHKITIRKSDENRPGDIRYYVSDSRKFMNQYGWSPKRDIKKIIADTFEWLETNKEKLKEIFK